MTVLVLTSGAASAQTQGYRPERPYRGIFASGVDNSTQSLTATATVSSGWDDDILADATGQEQPLSNRKGVIGQVSGGLNYGLSVDRASLSAGVGTSVRYYPSLEQDYFRTYNAGVGGTVRVLNKPQVTLRGAANYQPLSFLNAFPSLIDSPVVDAPEPDYVPVESQYISYDAGIALTQRLSRRVSVSLSGAYHATDQLDSEFWSQSAGVSVQTQMTRDVALRLGYSFTEGHYEGQSPVQVHQPDIGLDFARALSLTRRTSLAFGVGTDATVSNNNSTRVRAAGHAQLTHEIGRSWAARASFQRGTDFVDTISEPVFSDAVQASLVGLLTRRIQFTSIASATYGRTASTSSQFDSYRGSAGLSIAITRYMNTGVDYVYYKYAFGPRIQMPAGVPRESNRQSIRGHVSMWVPVFNRARR